VNAAAALHELSCDWLELQYVETPAGDVYAEALVTQAGEVVRVVDLDTGCDVELTAAELERVTAECRSRRENEVK
jgi:hypothetical protein